jgi:hypothetical protein
MDKQREERFANAELRVVMPPETDACKPKKIAGYAARFNSMSENLGGFRERIAPGAFGKSLLDADVRALWNHDANIVLGRNKSGTLRLMEDDVGLHFEVDMPETQLVRDMVMAPIERGDVSQCSFGFYTIEDSWENVDGEMIRTLLKCELLDVSPVTYPAYPETNVAARSLEAARSAQPQLWQNDIMRRRLELDATV